MRQQLLARVICACATLTILSGAVPAQTTETAQQTITSTTFRDIAQKTAPAVVNVKIKSGIEFGKGRGKISIPPGMGIPDDLREQLQKMYEQQAPSLTPEEQEQFKYSASASGVVIRPDGYIVTSNHVVSSTKPEDIEISFPDGKKFGQVKLTGADPLTDVAVLKIDARDLPSIQWGRSEAIQVGDFVVAIGNPLQFNNTVSEGIISAKHRTLGETLIEDLIQTTAMINPGNSGGALVNLQGELIGINMAIATSTGMWSGLGFAVPSDTARKVVEQIINKGKVSRGYLGIEMADLTGDVAKYMHFDKDFGVLVKNVTPGSPAEKAGIRRYDIIARVGDKVIQQPRELTRNIGSRAAGDQVTLDVFRSDDGKLQETKIPVTLGERPSEEQLSKSLRPPKNEEAKPPSGALGLGLVPAPGGRGVLVESVAPNSRAATAGIKKGDVIVQVNRQDVSSPADVKKALAQSEDTQMFFIQREGEDVIIVLSSGQGPGQGDQQEQ